MQAVTPPPDGGYPGGNTAEGQNALFSLTTGGYNTAVGFLSLHVNTTGAFNTANGAGALFANTASGNTATGAGALFSNTTGIENTAIGTFALFSNTTGDYNTALGTQSLFMNTTGTENTAIGGHALISNAADGNTAVGSGTLGNSTGSNNTALGAGAGASLTTGDGNVYIGENMSGPTTESNHTYIRNIKDTTVTGLGADYVSVDLTTGLLGHPSSSRRYKEDIKPMNKASEALYRLKPVSYRYKKDADKTQSLDYGLIAEDVAKVDPSLAIRDGKGQVENVRYNAINAMLLNEFLKEHRKVQQQEATITQLKAELQGTAMRQQKQIDALTAGLQKASAQLGASKPAPLRNVYRPKDRDCRYALNLFPLSPR
jgi:hypothetical protein